MMRVSAGVMASVVFGSVIGFAAAQTVAPPTCTTERGDYRGCALFAGGVPDLRGMTFAHGESELRFYLGSGNVFPERLLILHQTPDTTTARLFLIWPASIITDSFARSRCGETWSNTTGGLCVGQLDSTRDWRAVLRRLDDLGLQRIPGDPAKTRPPCHQDQRTASGNFIGCGVSGDGPVYDLAYRSEWVYWTYGFPSVAGPSAEAQRDGQISQLLSCAARGLGRRQCGP